MSKIKTFYTLVCKKNLKLIFENLQENPSIRFCEKNVVDKTKVSTND
jgi:hypothetical protein